MNAEGRMQEEANLKAAILYQDVDCATRALSGLERAYERADVFAACVIKPWRLDLLKDSAVAAEILAETADADLVVLAVEDQADITSRVMDWLEDWSAHRRVQDAALAVCGQGLSNGSSAGTVPALWRLAERRGLSFVCRSGSALNPPAAEIPLQDEVPLPPTTSLTTDRPNDAYRDWGINE